jgi:hypothetical protein
MPPAGKQPHLWITGPDPVLHDKYVAFLRARSQAHYRGELWTLTWDQWQEFWGEDWHRRGRLPHQIRMSRRDWNQPWCLDNMVKMTQSEHNRHNAKRRRLEKA